MPPKEEYKAEAKQEQKKLVTPESKKQLKEPKKGVKEVAKHV